MRIVARNRQLVQIMNRGGLRYVYPMVDQYCDCSEFRCAHNERWETVDNFAKSLNDDLPRLVLAAAGIDVEWVSTKYFYKQCIK